MACSKVCSGSSVENRVSKSGSAGFVAMAQTYFVPPASMPPSSGACRSISGSSVSIVRVYDHVGCQDGFFLLAVFGGQSAGTLGYPDVSVKVVSLQTFEESREIRFLRKIN